jgi:hypothetical protein
VSCADAYELLKLPRDNQLDSIVQLVSQILTLAVAHLWPENNLRFLWLFRLLGLPTLFILGQLLLQSFVDGQTYSCRSLLL